VCPCRSIYDFNHNSESAHEKLFREKGSIDPVPKISQAAAEKMLGRQYSEYYTFRGLAGRQVPLDITSKEIFGQVIVRIIRVAKGDAISGEKSNESVASSVIAAPPAATAAVADTDDIPGSGQREEKQDALAVAEVSSSKDQHGRSKYLSAEEIRADAEYDALLAAARAAITGTMTKVFVLCSSLK